MHCAVVGEGPAGLSCVLALLDRDGVKSIEWYKARRTRTRRHIVIVEGRTQSIRELETSLENRIIAHPLFHSIVTVKEEPYTTVTPTAASTIYLADGYNSKNRNTIFFEGKEIKPIVYLVERCIIVYTGLSSIEGGPPDGGRRYTLTVGTLREWGVREPEHLINLMKFSFAAMQKDSHSRGKPFDPYIDGFRSPQIFREDVMRGLQFFYSQREDLLERLKKFEVTPEEITVYAAETTALFQSFQRDLDILIRRGFGEGGAGDTIFVPIYRKHAYFPIKRERALRDGKTYHLVGDAAFGHAPGGENISIAMQYARDLVKNPVETERKAFGAWLERIVAYP